MSRPLRWQSSRRHRAARRAWACRSLNSLRVLPVRRASFVPVAWAITPPCLMWPALVRQVARTECSNTQRQKLCEEEGDHGKRPLAAFPGSTPLTTSLERRRRLSLKCSLSASATTPPQRAFIGDVGLALPGDYLPLI